MMKNALTGFTTNSLPQSFVPFSKGSELHTANKAHQHSCQHRRLQPHQSLLTEL